MPAAHAARAMALPESSRYSEPRATLSDLPLMVNRHCRDGAPADGISVTHVYSFESL